MSQWGGNPGASERECPKIRSVTGISFQIIETKVDNSKMARAISHSGTFAPYLIFKWRHAHI